MTVLKETEITEMIEEPRVTFVNLENVDFDVSPLNQENIRKDLSEFGSNYINKYGKKGEKDDLALVVGRFQPPHMGHLFEILAALEVSDHVVIGLGSANPDINSPKNNDKKSIQADIDNPLPAEEREFLLTHLLGKIEEQRGESLLNRVSFLPINDVGNNEKWRNMVLDDVEKLRGAPPDVIVANDGWVKGIFHEFGVHTHSVPFLEREKGKRYEGRLERARLRKSQDGKPSVFAASGPHKIRRPGV